MSGIQSKKPGMKRYRENENTRVKKKKHYREAKERRKSPEPQVKEEPNL